MRHADHGWHGLSCQPTRLTGISGPSKVAALSHHCQIAVIGGGPAGLRAAEVAAAAGVDVTLYDGKPSVGRKFLVAGKGGLNLTHGEALEKFVARYSGPGQAKGIWDGLIAGFDPTALREWAAGMGVETFQASSGRVYPRALKAAPLLRRWIVRLKDLGVRFEMNHKLTSLEVGDSWQLGFENGNSATADAVILAMGGGSWPQTGSDGRWLEVLAKLGISTGELVPANCGWEHDWPAAVLAVAEGQPLKNVQVRAGDQMAIGELMVTRYGLEGGAIYQLGEVLRAMSQPEVRIDFKPTFSHEQLVAKMESVRRGFLEEARVRWKLSEAAVAILARGEWTDAESLAREVKSCAISLKGPRAIAEAISSAGGVRWDAIDCSLMIADRPGLFVAGEMIDWEAPTGGYLMQGCFATATRAATSAVAWLTGGR